MFAATAFNVTNVSIVTFGGGWLCSPTFVAAYWDIFRVLFLNVAASPTTTAGRLSWNLLWRSKLAEVFVVQEEDWGYGYSGRWLWWLAPSALICCVLFVGLRREQVRHRNAKEERYEKKYPLHAKLTKKSSRKIQKTK